MPYLTLPAGWLALLAPGYEDVWIDEGLCLTPLLAMIPAARDREGEGKHCAR